METDDDLDYATMRESFPLVQSILFIQYTDLLPSDGQENRPTFLSTTTYWTIFNWTDRTNLDYKYVYTIAIWPTMTFDIIYTCKDPSTTFEIYPR